MTEQNQNCNGSSVPAREKCFSVPAWEKCLIVGYIAGALAIGYHLFTRQPSSSPQAQASPEPVPVEPKTNPESLERICDLDLNLTSTFTEPSKERLEQYKEAFGFGQKLAVKHPGGMPATSPYEFSVKELDGLEGNILNIFGRSYKIGDAKLLITKKDALDREGQLLFHAESQLLFLMMTRDDGQLAHLRADVSNNEEDPLSGLVEGVFKAHSIHMEGKTYGQTFTLTRLKIAKP